MQDLGKIIIGIIVFLVLLSIPVIVTQATGNADYVPDPQPPSQDVLDNFIAENYPDFTDYDSSCIESKEYMRLNHMNIIYDWRAWAVRDDADGDEDSSYYTSLDGKKEWFMSLTETCLGCHTDRDVFCNRCHEYTATQPNCWNCHNDVSEGS